MARVQRHHRHRRRQVSLLLLALLGGCATLAEREERELRRLALGPPPAVGTLRPDLEPEVAAWVSWWAGEGCGWFSRWLDRRDQRHPSIARALAAEGLPESLEVLPLIESGFSGEVTSRTGAVGEWQLTVQTARSLGLRVDGEVDERRDSDRSAAAAARYLAQLSRQFKDPLLAWAAYNAGPRAMREAMRKAGREDFWGLARGGHLSAETANYVPKLLAAQILLRERPRCEVQR